MTEKKSSKAGTVIENCNFNISPHVVDATLCEAVVAIAKAVEVNAIALQLAAQSLKPTERVIDSIIKIL